MLNVSKNINSELNVNKQFFSINHETALCLAPGETGYHLSYQPVVSREMMQETCLKGFSAKKGQSLQNRSFKLTAFCFVSATILAGFAVHKPIATDELL